MNYVGEQLGWFLPWVTFVSMMVLFYLSRISGAIENLRRTENPDAIRGLVRAAEMIEQRDGENLCDVKVRRALTAARAAGWGNDKTGKPL